MAFKKVKDCWEIVREASIKNTLVIGGFTKLVSFSRKSLRTSKITAILSRDWYPDYRDTSYFKLGFKLDCLLKPSKRYTDFLKVYSNALETKKCYPIYNSGNWKFSLTFDTVK